MSTYNQKIFNYSNWAFTPDEDFIHPNQIVIVVTSGTITLPNYQLNDKLPEGYAFTGIQTALHSGALIQVQSPDIIMSQVKNSSRVYTGVGKFEIILAQKASSENGYINVWIGTGDLFNSNDIIYDSSRCKRIYASHFY